MLRMHVSVKRGADALSASSRSNMAPTVSSYESPRSTSLYPAYCPPRCFRSSAMNFVSRDNSLSSMQPTDVRAFPDIS